MLEFKRKFRVNNNNNSKLCLTVLGFGHLNCTREQGWEGEFFNGLGVKGWASVENSPETGLRRRLRVTSITNQKTDIRFIEF